MGGGLAWVALQHGRNRNERSHSEHSHCVPVRGKPCPEAITAGSFCILLAVQKYEEKTSCLQALIGSFDTESPIFILTLNSAFEKSFLKAEIGDPGSRPG